MKTMEDYTVYCTEDQAKRALNQGAPLTVHKGTVYVSENMTDYVTKSQRRLIKVDDVYYLVPTKQQMISWLIDLLGGGYREEFGSIDVALDYLEKGCKK